ncbi:MAG: FHA domain-containing protein [Gloeomargarita sp. HHBFW_bins_162]
MGRVRWSLLVVLILGWVSPARAQKTPDQWVLWFQPTLVYVTSGYRGQWRWEERTWETLVTRTATGVLVHPDGQILTLATVAQMAEQGEASGKQFLLEDLVRQRLELYNQVYPNQKIPITPANIREGVIIARQEARLEQLERFNNVFLSGGREDQVYGFQVKKYNTQTNLALLTVQLTQTPTLVFTDTQPPTAGTTVYALAQFDPTLTTTPEIFTGTWKGQNMAFANPMRLEGGIVFLANGQVLGLADVPSPAETASIPPVKLITVSTIRQFLASAQVENRDSPVNALWQKALDHFWQAHYRRSQPVLQSILERYPQHHPAQTLLVQAQERIDKGEDRAPSWSVGLIIVGLGVLILGSGAVGLAVWISRRPRRVPPMQGIVSSPLPSPDNITVPLASFDTTDPVTPTSIPLTEQVEDFPEAQPTRMMVSPPVSEPVIASEPEPPTRVLGFPPEPVTQMLTPPPVEPAAEPPPLTPRTEVYRPPRLECIAGPAQGEEFILVGTHYLGRDGQRCQIVIPDPQVSGQHALIDVTDDRVILRDCGSTNGTFINSVLHPRIQEVQLHDQDVIILGQKGSVKFRFHAASS